MTRIPVAFKADLPKDTGWRNVSSELHADATGTLLVRRQGSRVTARLYTAVTVSQTFMRLVSLPVGWRPRGKAPIGVVPYGLLGQVLTVLVSGDTWRLEAHRASLLNLTDYLQGEVTWLTDEPWPTTLPGIPA